MMRKEIPRRNRNQTGWWIASYIERFEFYDEDKLNANRRCLAWENTILIKAEDREEAYQKAVDCARLFGGIPGNIPYSPIPLYLFHFLDCGSRWSLD